MSVGLYRTIGGKTSGNVLDKEVKRDGANIALW
jgi:hypothetical protein